MKTLPAIAWAAACVMGNGAFSQLAPAPPPDAPLQALALRGRDTGFATARVGTNFYVLPNAEIVGPLRFTPAARATANLSSGTNSPRVYVIPTPAPFEMPESAPGFAGKTNLPAPGIYESAPYKCIVVVPGPHPNDISLVRPAHPVHPRAPGQITPELRLIPRSRPPK